MILGKITMHCPTILSLRRAPRGDDDNRAFNNTCGSWALGAAAAGGGLCWYQHQAAAYTSPTHHLHSRVDMGVYTLVGHPRRCTPRFPTPETRVHLQGNGHTTNSTCPGMGLIIAPLPHNQTVPSVVRRALCTCWWKNTAWFWKGSSWLKMHHIHTHMQAVIFMVQKP